MGTPTPSTVYGTNAESCQYPLWHVARATWGMSKMFHLLFLGNGWTDCVEIWHALGDPLVTDQARIQDFCQGRAPREWWPYTGWEWAIFDIPKHRFATFQDVYCYIMPEWCWTTIQETPVSLLSALETREPAPSARVLPSQGWAPAPAPPGSAPAAYAVVTGGVSLHVRTCRDTPHTALLYLSQKRLDRLCSNLVCGLGVISEVPSTSHWWSASARAHVRTPFP